MANEVAIKTLLFTLAYMKRSLSIFSLFMIMLQLSVIVHENAVPSNSEHVLSPAAAHHFHAGMDYVQDMESELENESAEFEGTYLMQSNSEASVAEKQPRLFYDSFSLQAIFPSFLKVPIV